jgi:DNA-binding NarL/FixJ family response regulator
MGEPCGAGSGRSIFLMEEFVIDAEESEEFEVVGTAENGEQAIKAVHSLTPDALVIDVWMPILDGLRVAKQLQTANCPTKVIFLSSHEGPEFLDAALSAGASGYVIKSRLSTDLIPAIRRASWDKFLYPGRINGQVYSNHAAPRIRIGGVCRVSESFALQISPDCCSSSSSS